MKCPYCDKEMSEGYIPIGSGIIQWLPKEHKMPIYGFRKFRAEKFGVKLSKLAYLSAKKVVAHYCKDCRMIIISEREASKKF